MQGQPLLCHDLKAFDDPDIGFMREIAAHREEELALGIMPDVITYVICGNVAIDDTSSDGYCEVLTTIIGIQNIQRRTGMRFITVYHEDRSPVMAFKNIRQMIRTYILFSQFIAFGQPTRNQFRNIIRCLFTKEMVNDKFLIHVFLTGSDNTVAGGLQRSGKQRC